MAQFEPAFNETMKHEGGYANNPADRGGETYKGIARKMWPGWKGWILVDAAKQKTGWPHNMDAMKDLQAAVAQFYQANFWPHYIAEIQDQDVANWFFDKAVNMGLGQATKLIQRAAGVVDDGRYGPKTANAIAAADPTELLKKCREQARAFYRSLADKNPSQERFLKGWLARA